MEANVSSLREMNERMNAWTNEKPQWGGNGSDLRLQPGDLVLFQFVANGDEGDRFIKVYRSHIVSKTTQDGRRFNETRYCPIRTGEVDLECSLCVQGHEDVKERMSVWMHVSHIFHTQLPQPRKGEQPKQFPLVRYEGENYFNEEVNSFMIWHSSAWRDSPWASILKLGELYKGLHNFTAQLIRKGTGTDTRYSVVAIPQSEMLSPELYARAQTECEPIIDILHRQISSAVQAQPSQETPSIFSSSTANTPQLNYNPTIQPFVASGASVPNFSVPALEANKEATEPVTETPETQTEQQPPEDEKRPMQKLF